MLSIILPNHNEDNVHEFIEEIEEAFPESEIIISQDRYGKGKGWAVREALSQASGDWVALLDADGDIRPGELSRMLLSAGYAEIVVGKKRSTKLLSWRGIISLSARVFIKLLFNLQVETQTGAKIFRRDAIDQWATDGFLFDVEILWKAQRRGFRVCEIPVECKITKSKSIGTLWKTFLESLSLWYRLSFRSER